MKIKLIPLMICFPILTMFANEDAAIANYKKTCKQCHGSAYYVAKVKESHEWEEYFINDAKKLLNAHLKDEKAMKKLNSNYFTKRIDDLKVFLMENGKDMGTIPPCNSTTCGFDLRLLDKNKKALHHLCLKKPNKIRNIALCNIFIKTFLFSLKYEK